MSLTWKDLQVGSSEVLSTGLTKLTKSDVINFGDSCPSAYGNYLIDSSTLTYIGEGKNLKKRLRQQSRERTSTFYKNYQKLIEIDRTAPKNLKISDFNVRTLSTSLGRKEIEEFGIVNLPTNLNRFQKGKRDFFKGQTSKIQLWDEVQTNKQDLLIQGEKALFNCSHSSWYECSPPSSAGIYWIESGNDVIYVGESSNIADRWNVHSQKTYFSALRRNIGRTLFGFELQTVKGRKRYFHEKEDKEITKYLKKTKILTYPVKLGRFELEELLIQKYNPPLNRK